MKSHCDATRAVYATLVRDTARNYLRGHRATIAYIREPFPWVISAIGEQLAPYLAQENVHLHITSSIRGLSKNSIHHFGSLNAYLGQPATHRVAERSIVTVFHIDPHDQRRASLSQALRDIPIIHTACTTTRDDLGKLGIDTNRIAVIPLGVDTELFTPGTKNQKDALRDRLNIPRNATVIGSFQKDGVGWGEGTEPKLIKGPDILVEALQKIYRSQPIHVLLSGPARGYVIRKLQQATIPFTYVGFLKRPQEVAALYHALDLYLITSRLEGGPQQLLEAWASGVPIVTTPVGMVTDLAHHDLDIILADDITADAIAMAAQKLLYDPALAATLQQAGPGVAAQYTWEKISNRYYKELYQPLLKLFS